MEPKKPITPVRVVLWLVPILVGVALELGWFGPQPPANRGLALLIAMALWWVTETFPLHWVALLPLVMAPLFPALIDKQGALLSRVENTITVGNAYLNPFIMIFMGGMMIGMAMEQHNLHQRIALNIMKVIGSSPRRMLLGFMVSTAFMSMWISNTATAVMMVPIGLAVIAQLESREGRRLPLLGQSIMLSIAYAANIGGIGTLIGTPPNMQLRGFVSTIYPDHPIDFLGYMTVGFPVVVLLLPITYALLVWISRREVVRTVESNIIDDELTLLGPMARAEKIVLGVFLFTSAMWILSDPLRTALKSLVEKPHWLSSVKGDQLDAFWALCAPVTLISLRVLSWRSVRRMPWDILILLGGSYALGTVVQGSRLSNEMVAIMKGATDLHPVLLMITVTTTTIILTAFSANAASAQLMMILISGSFDASRTQPAQTVPYLYGASIASSCDFMLPCGTPPNAIVFGTRYISIQTMAKTGFTLDLLSAIVVALWLSLAARHWI